MTRQFLIEQIKQKRSYLCIGLDTDITKIPPHLRSLPDAIFQFNKAIIDATKDLCVSYKINTAFYEALGVKGWQALEQTVNYIPSEHFKIADAKRGDIGNTSSQYAKAFFETLNFDAVTVAPYMGEDSVKPFLEYKNKWTIVLGLTSNPGSKDFEQLKVVDKATNNADEFLYERVLQKVSEWGSVDNLMFVVGATKAKDFEPIRKIVPEHFLLVPGVGSQGGSLEEVTKYGKNNGIGLLVNVSRAVIFASDKENFAEEARKAALQYQQEMEKYI
ncbi:orotidine-5'-phosphate decarboxylase [Ferruginibacter albus]|uniref:orotidine-5'-phosphate decarboxylase n=1 Tax=Ferruginibacter albus TaxID=2875540 RepID=UPI001CC5DFE5|nr:orotidine-5'-phosphate decarboxylase [Ferruginibacter albus]UAY52457.1 orotidine-5'-phosphate decarboxylase [Ferruginibacter albus]